MSGNIVDYRAHVASELLGCDKPHHLESYFTVYDNLLARSDVRVLQIEDPEDPGRQRVVPLTYKDILNAANVLRVDSSLTPKQAIQRLATEPNSAYAQQQSKLAILIAVRCMFMLDSSIREGVGVREPWQEDERLVDFVCKSFPKSLELSNRALQALQAQKSLKAWKLKIRSGITFKGTDNLAQHLLLDPANSTLYIFHHTAFLKAQLARLQAMGFGKEDGMSTCLRIGSLPPRLLAETLRSLQAILFHFDDHRSSKILERLIRKDGFDEDCAQPDGYKMFDNSSKFDYFYWGERLATLHEFLQNRPPRNKFDRWIKWQTSDSNAFLVAITALVISVVIGLLSLGLAVCQTWIAWKTWKESVSQSGDIGVVKMQQFLTWIQEQGNKTEV